MQRTNSYHSEIKEEANKAAHQVEENPFSKKGRKLAEQDEGKLRSAAFPVYSPEGKFNIEKSEYVTDVMML